MRLLLATMSHETNTFSPVPTRLERFCRDGTTLLAGQTAIDFYPEVDGRQGRRRLIVLDNMRMDRGFTAYTRGAVRRRSKARLCEGVGCG
jgi:microcystin degradation protein MlrC